MVFSILVLLFVLEHKVMAYRMICPLRHVSRVVQIGAPNGGIPSGRNFSTQKLQKIFPGFEKYLSEIRIYFADKPPKGFEKYFKPKPGERNIKPPEAKTSEKRADGTKRSPSSEPPPPSTSSPKGTSNSPRPPGDPWSSFLGGGGPRLGGQGGKGPGGGMGGEGGDKMIFLAVAGTILLLGTFTYYEMSYTEITWKDFVNM